MNVRSREGLIQSIKDRLKNEAQARGRPFAEFLELYAAERFLNRLGLSRHRDDFVLKGALLLRSWLGVNARPTRDIDLLGPPGLDAQRLRTILQEILQVEVEPDGIEVDEESIEVSPIRAESAVVGLRARFDGRLGRTRLRYQVDAGVGDEVFPPPEDIIPGELLDLEQASVRAYTPYTSIAEKLEAMIILGGANTRMKDYYDLSELPAHLAFDGAILAESIQRTLARRDTRIDELPLEGLGDEFAAHTLNADAWRTFVTRGKLNVDDDLPAVVATIRHFVDPVLGAIVAGRSFTQRWRPGGPWRE